MCSSVDPGYLLIRTFFRIFLCGFYRKHNMSIITSQTCLLKPTEILKRKKGTHTLIYSSHTKTTNSIKCRPLESIRLFISLNHFVLQIAICVLAIMTCASNFGIT